MKINRLKNDREYIVIEKYILGYVISADLYIQPLRKFTRTYFKIEVFCFCFCFFKIQKDTTSIYIKEDWAI